jgi:pre-mRNA-splicing factor ISY1
MDDASSTPAATATAEIHAVTAASYIPFLTPAHLRAPTLPTATEMEGVLLALRKKALVEEYFGE